MQIAGVVFPVPILLLIPAREYLLPRIFGRRALAVLDPAPYETVEVQQEGGKARCNHSQESRLSECAASPSNVAGGEDAQPSSSKGIEAFI